MGNIKIINNTGQNIKVYPSHGIEKEISPYKDNFFNVEFADNGKVKKQTFTIEYKPFKEDKI